MFKILKIIIKIRKKSNTPYMGVNLIVMSSSGYHVHAIDTSWIPIPGYCLRVYI